MIVVEIEIWVGITKKQVTKYLFIREEDKETLDDDVGYFVEELYEFTQHEYEYRIQDDPVVINKAILNERDKKIREIEKIGGYIEYLEENFRIPWKQIK